MGTNLLGFSIGRGSGALKGLSDHFDGRDHLQSTYPLALYSWQFQIVSNYLECVRYESDQLTVVVVDTHLCRLRDDPAVHLYRCIRYSSFFKYIIGEFDQLSGRY